MSALGRSCEPPFSPRCWNSVPASDTQRLLRELFCQWGRPGQIRVDHGFPWGNHSDAPPDLALWLLGLDIALHWNPVGSPQHNGVVERSQGVAQCWAEPEKCRSVAQLQKRLDRLDHVQRCKMPNDQGEIRWQKYPDLAHSGRVYQRAKEKDLWQLQPVLAYLEQRPLSRRVDRQGKVSVYNRPIMVSPRFAGCKVWLQLDAAQGAWIIADARGCQLRVQPALWLNQPNIIKLQVTQNRRSKK
jgi:hypothetical protein